MTIPKIIHQTWKNDTVPEPLLSYRERWMEKYPDFEFKFYTDEDLENIVKERYPQYLGLYKSFTSPIERVDFARYVILEKYGGIYADLDMIPINKISDDVFDTENIIFSSEPIEHAKKIYSRRVVLCNAFMMSPPQHEFWPKLIKYIVDNYEHNLSPVYTTGPMIITRYYENHLIDFKNITISSPCDFFPICNKGFSKKTQTYHDVVYENVSEECDISKAYAAHLWANTWVLPWYKDPRFKNKKYWLIFLLLLIFLILGFYLKKLM